jgi:hypothetical protein
VQQGAQCPGLVEALVYLRKVGIQVSAQQFRARGGGEAGQRQAVALARISDGTPLLPHDPAAGAAAAERPADYALMTSLEGRWCGRPPTRPMFLLAYGL